MSLRSITPCDFHGICPYGAEYSGHAANHTAEDYENIARILDAGIEAVCIHNCDCCPLQKVCNELNRAIAHCLTKCGRL